MKQIVNFDAAKKLVRHIEDTERKLTILKNYVNMKDGTVNISVVARILLSADKSVQRIRDQVVKFL